MSLPEAESKSGSPIPLIINADDFGSSDAANRAIIRAHLDGVCTSTSLMVNEPAAEAAVELARENPSLAVGLHLVLVLGHSSLSPSQIPHLVNQNACFSDSSFEAGIKYYFHPAARRELRLEMRAQFEKFAATGLPFSHVDGHTHLHMHPVIFRELVDLCEEFGVRRVRVVRGERRISEGIGRLTAGDRITAVVFDLLARHCEKVLKGRGFIVPSRVYGLLQSGRMDESCLLSLLQAIPAEISEIYSHPMESGRREDLLSNPGGESELNALLSHRVKAAIARRGFTLSTYEGLSKGIPDLISR